MIFTDYIPCRDAIILKRSERFVLNAENAEENSMNTEPALTLTIIRHMTITKTRSKNGRYYSAGSY